MKFLALLLLSLAAFAAPACAAAGSAAEPLTPARYSFDDVYRLTVGQPLGTPGPAQAEAPLRVAMVVAPPSEPRFTVRPLPAPERWLLLLAGLALAGWVAHRRLSYL